MFEDYNEIITVEQLAELLQIGMNTAYKLVQSGEIETFRINKAYRIQRSAITDYIIRKSGNYSSNNGG